MPKTASAIAAANAGSGGSDMPIILCPTQSADRQQDGQCGKKVDPRQPISIEVSELPPCASKTELALQYDPILKCGPLRRSKIENSRCQAFEPGLSKGREQFIARYHPG
jgi:hypothetical protein